MTDETPQHVVTLNELIASAATEWSPKDRTTLIEALRTQRERWNTEQAIGSRKRVTSKQIDATKADPTSNVKAGGRKLSLTGLKL